LGQAREGTDVKPRSRKHAAEKKRMGLSRQSNGAVKFKLRTIIQKGRWGGSGKMGERSLS